MSTPPPTNPQDPDGSAADVTDVVAPDTVDSTPTEVYPPAAPPAAPAPTGGYGDAYVAPTAPPLPPAAGQPTVPYGAPTAPYGAPTPPYLAPSGPPVPDTRSKAVAWTALGLAAGGTLLSIIGIVPVPWVGLVAVLIGGLLLLAGFIFSIVGLAGQRYGGKPLSITALVLSLVGATIGSFALIWSIILVGVSSAGSSPSKSAPATSCPERATILRHRRSRRSSRSSSRMFARRSTRSSGRSTRRRRPRSSSRSSPTRR
jgi:hypothetical protein